MEGSLYGEIPPQLNISATVHICMSGSNQETNGPGKMRQKQPFSNFTIICAFYAIITSGSALAKPVQAQQSGQQLTLSEPRQTTCKTITVGGPSSWQPISYIASDGRQTGLGIDIIEEYARRENIAVKIDIDLPWARTLDLLFQGKIDVSAGAYFKTERQWRYQYSDPYYHDDIMVFQHVDRRFDFGGIDDLRNYRGARPHGGSLGDKIDRYSKQDLDLVYSPTDDLIFDLLTAGRVDYVLLGRYDGMATLQKLGVEDTIIPVEPAAARTPVHLLFSRNSPCLQHLERINMLIAELSNNDTLRERTNYHLGQTVFGPETGS